MHVTIVSTQICRRPQREHSHRTWSCRKRARTAAAYRSLLQRAAPARPHDAEAYVASLGAGAVGPVVRGPPDGIPEHRYRAVQRRHLGFGPLPNTRRRVHATIRMHDLGAAPVRLCRTSSGDADGGTPRRSYNDWLTASLSARPESPFHHRIAQAASYASSYVGAHVGTRRQTASRSTGRGSRRPPTRRRSRTWRCSARAARGSRSTSTGWSRPSPSAGTNGAIPVGNRWVRAVDRRRDLDRVREAEHETERRPAAHARPLPRVRAPNNRQRSDERGPRRRARRSGFQYTSDSFRKPPSTPASSPPTRCGARP